MARSIPALKAGLFAAFAAATMFAAAPAPAGDATPAAAPLSASVDLSSHAKELWSDPAALVAANPEGTATIVAFVDYQSVGAQALHAKLADVLKVNKDLRLVVKPWSMLGPLSTVSAKAVIAAAKQGKFAAFHAALLSDPGSHTWYAIRDLAAVVGLDWGRMQADMDAAETAQAVDANTKLAETLKITDSPVFIAGGRILPEPWNKLDLGHLAAAARTGQ